MKYILLYDDTNYTIFLQNLISSICKYSDFKIVVFNKRDIEPEFIINNQKCLNKTRGGGYWLWKPYIINETLNKIKDGDLLFYLDAKYYFIENI